ETAKSFKCERGLGFLRDERMTAGEHEAKAVIFDFALHQRGGIGAGIVGPLLDERDDLRLLFVKKLFAANEIKREVLGGLSEPGGGLFWNAVIGPGFQGADHRFLDDVFGKLKAVEAEDASKDGNELAGFVTKEVICQAGN